MARLAHSEGAGQAAAGASKARSMSRFTQFHGRRTDRWSAGAAELSETVYAPRERTDVHAHGDATIAFVLGGGFVERQGSRAIECKPGTLMLRPAWVEHEDHFSERGCRCFNIEIPAVLTAGLTLAATDRKVGEASWAAQRLLASLRVAADGLTLEAELAELVDALSPSPAPGVSARMARVAEELAASYTRPWSLRALAHEAGVHPVHFARAFRAAFGESVGEHVHRLRVEHAARELARTTSAIAEIATDAGFTDQAHLTRIFRRRTGATPARFRRTFRPTPTLRSFKTP